MSSVGNYDFETGARSVEGTINGHLGQFINLHMYVKPGRNTSSDENMSDSNDPPECFNGFKILNNALKNGCFDVVIIQLGTNDMRPPFNRSESEIAERIGRLTKLVHEKCEDAKVVVVSPPKIEIDDIVDAMVMGNMEVVGLLPEKLQPLVKKLCKTEGAVFVDTVKNMGKAGSGDGVHLSAEQNVQLGGLIAEALQQCLGLSSLQGRTGKEP